MLSIEDQRALERLECLEPPEPDDFDYDAWFGEMADREYEQRRECEILGRDFHV